ncbi:LuxR C-terminal-related transcriptional regulator [Streptomyces sp. ML-6]|nr:LuxR family transcriptional regulator [Streptomyces sp. ML-6]MDK0524706.1 LuxR C-terminal-related transcriptional regulator [Streptomyces sp. ML-6]
MELAERCRAQQLLDRLFRNARDGRGQAALVLGPPGVGKTGVVDYVKGRAERAGATVLSATASAAERSSPLGVVAQLLSSLGCSMDEIAAMCDSSAQVAAAVHDAVSLLAERTPVIVTVDDIHEMDHESLRCLLYVIHRVAPLRVLVLLTGSSALPQQSLLLTAEYMRNPNCSLVRLAALCASCVEEVLVEHMGSGVCDRTVALWRRASGGSPLLLHALLKDWSGSGGAGRGPVPPPPGGDAVRFAVQYLHGLMTEDGLRTARALAVLGESATAERVERLLHHLGMSAGEAARSRNALDAAGLTDGLRYHLEAARDVVLDRIPGDERALLHRSAALALRESNAELGEVAGHLIHARPGPEPWAVIALREAAAQALHEHDAERAIAFLRSAYDASADGSTRAVVRAELAQAEWEMDPGAVRWHLTDLLDEHRAGRLSREHSLLLGMYLLWSGRTQEAGAILTELESVQEELSQDTRARLKALRVWFAYFFPTYGARYRDDPLEPPHDPGQGIVSVDPQWDGALVLASLLAEGPTEDACEAAEQLLQAQVPHRPQLAPTMAALISLIRAARLARAADWCDRLVVDRSEYTTTCQALLLAASAILESWLGNFTTALTRAEQALALLPPSAWGVAIGLPLSAKVLACTGLGDLDAAAECFRTPVPQLMFQSLPGLHYLQARGRLHLAAGRHQAALGDFYACRDLMDAWNLRVSVFTAWRVHAAEALAELGDRDEAVRLLTEELAQPDTGSPWLRKQAQALYDRLCGVCARPPVVTEELPALSRAEHRVAQLAQEGLTNREIAEQLGVTPSTVEQHLTRVYRKLGVRGRTGLSPALNSAAVLRA